MLRVCDLRDEVVALALASLCCLVDNVVNVLVLPIPKPDLV